MKKTLFIIGAIFLLCMIVFVSLFFDQSRGMDGEREWFAKALRYEFSARVDSIRMFNENTGKLWCTLTSGNPKTHREDSLKRFFKEHDMLYLIFHRSADSVIFIFPNAKTVVIGDSVHVSSEKNTVQFFRDGTRVADGQLTTTLTGFGRPFFMKKK